MPYSYSCEELMRLRESPLVCKPPSLPPVEEWMGPIPEQNQTQAQNQRRIANKGKGDETFAGDGATSRRPLFEARAKSTNAPEDIVLGPPKTAFASARSVNNPSDTPQRSSFLTNDEVGVKNDRNAFRDKYSRDGQRNERDGDKNRDPRPGITQNRRSVKDDSDLWSNARHSKALGREDGERSHRRNGDRDHDRDREGGREPRLQRGYENHPRDGEREGEGGNGVRRATFGRGHNEPSWYRDDGQKEEDGHEDSGNPRPWERERRGTRGQDRDWKREGRVEMDPEWMDGPGPEEKTQVKTSEDFERWKKQMKTGNGATQDTSLPPAEQRPSHQPSASTGNSSGRGKLDTPLVVDSSFDDFFGLWDQPGKSKEIVDKKETWTPSNPTSTGAKSSKSSKFTGFFNPRPDPEPQDQPSLNKTLALPQDSSSEDKEGFQRILNLLGQQQPQNGEITPPRQAQREVPASPYQSPQAGDRNDLFNLLKSSSPQGNAMPPTRDSEFLLKLMQQPQQGRHDPSQSNPRGRRTQDPTPGSLNFSNMTISPNETPQHTHSTGPPPGFCDEGPRDKLNPGGERRGPPPGLFDLGKQQRPSPVGAPQQSAFPPGMQRPPGLEQLPPGYAQQFQPQRQNMVPPPGFQVPSRGQNVLPPGLFNNPNQFGMPSNARGMPPPGFMNAPPPGFPLPFGQESTPFGNFGDAGFGQGGFGGQRRQ